MNQTTFERADNKNSKNFQPSGRREASKNELVDGRVTPKPAANRWHNLIVSNLTIAIGSRTNRNSCEIYSGGMQVQMGKDSICFPDVVVVAGEPVFVDDSTELLKNPSVLIEIVSSAVKGRTQKLEEFLAVPNIKECILVNEDEMRIEHYARQSAKQWIYRIYNTREDVISLDSIGCKLSLAEVYAQVKVRESELNSKAVN
jgi:Uma2 family endonuclease